MLAGKAAKHQVKQVMPLAKEQASWHSAQVSRPADHFLQRYLGNGYVQAVEKSPQTSERPMTQSTDLATQAKCTCDGSCASCVHREDKRRGVATKLAIGPANDAYEREADSVAEAVLRMPNAPLAASKFDRGLSSEYAEVLRRQPDEDEEAYRELPEPRGLTAAVVEEELEETVQAKRASSSATSQVTTAFDAEVHAMNSTGRPLPGFARRFMEPRFGADFSGVRIHDTENAAHAARGLQAKAFTIGHDIYFGQGEFQPQSSLGRRLLAHELTHVVQQGHAHTLISDSQPSYSSRPTLIQRDLSTAFSSYRGTCDCGRDLGNNCAHYLSDALIRSGYADDLDGGTGGLYRRHNGRVVCESGRPVRAKELRNWFADQATATVDGEPTEGDRYWAVYQERAGDGQGHVLIHSHSGATYTYRGTGDYPSWRTQTHYGF